MDENNGTDEMPTTNAGPASVGGVMVPADELGKWRAELVEIRAMATRLAKAIDGFLPVEAAGDGDTA